MFLTIETVEEMHVEITNNCNARCPMCSRNINGGSVSPGLKIGDWSKEDIDLVFSKDLTNLKFVYFCGTHGDPLTARYLFEAIEKLKKMGVKIEIFTNGSLKTVQWWKEFVKLLDSRDRITFGVDGIETNHLYRQNTDINKILTHMEIACNSKARVRWDFLVFKHNEYELENCRNKALELGVTDFRMRRTPRFDKTEKFPVLNNEFQITHYLEPPLNVENRHPSLEKMSAFYEKKSKTDEQIIQEAKKRHNLKSFNYYKFNNDNSYQISCLYKESKKIYVNSRLDVFPCCYISDQYEGFKSISEMELKYPSGELNLRTKGWEEIFNHKYFSKDLIESWKAQNTPVRCIQTCGIASREKEQNVKIDL